MILTCPECNTKYMVPDAAFGEAGRMFRCSHCKHSWFQNSPDGSDEILRVHETDEEIAPLAEDVKQEEAPPQRKPLFARMMEETAPAELPEIKLQMQRPVPLVQPPPYRVGGMKALSIFLLILVLLLYPFAYRKSILKDYPELSILYELFGVYNTNGLTVADMKMSKTRIDERTVRVAIDCKVVNESKEKRPLPALMAFLMNSDGKEVYKSGNLIETGKKIHAGESLACKQFAFDMQNDEVDHIIVELADNFEMGLRKRK